MRYFMYGDAAFYPDPALRAIQEFSSDFNNDGKLLGVADYLTLLNILTYGLGPYGGGAPLLSPVSTAPATVAITTAGDDKATFVLGVKTERKLGGMHFVFDLNGATAGVPELTQDVAGITIRSHQVGAQLRVVISPPPDGIPAAIDAGSYELLRISTSDAAALKLVHADLSDPAGRAVEAKIEAGTVPSSFSLGQNVPNPFNAGTVIPFSVDQPSHVRIDVFDVLGRRVATILDDDMSPGSHQVTWHGFDRTGAPVATGIYFYRISTVAGSDVRKMVLLK